jgi:hypothetical protein
MGYLEQMFVGGQIYYMSISVEKKKPSGSYNLKLAGTNSCYPYLSAKTFYL